MPRRYSPSEVARILESLGWRFSRQRGSHAIFTKEGEPFNIVVPISSRQVQAGTLGSIKRRAGLTTREFDEIADEVL